MIPTREYMPFMPEWTPYLMYLFFFLAIGIFLYRFNYNLRIYGIGWIQYFKELKDHLKNESQVRFGLILNYVFGQKKIIRKKYAGVMHVLIFIGIIVLFIGTFLIFLQEDILKYAGIKFLKGAFYLTFEVVMDTFGLFLVIGSLMALYRRLIIKPEYLESNAFDYILLLALLFMGVSGFILEGMRLSITQPPWAKYSYFGYIFSWFFARESLQTIYPIIWWAHALVAFSIIAVIPYTKLFHIVLIPTNLVFADLKPSGKLTTPFNLLQIMESEEDMDIEVGISKTSELKWKKRVEVDACVNCGRCQEVCPAYAAGRDLSPRLVIQEVKTHLSDRDKTLINGTISENTIWSCTNCYGCVEECPAHIHHVDLITDFRRFLIGDGKIDEQKITILSNLDRNGNPYGVPSYQRAEWLNSLEAPKVMDNPDFEYLYWIGCAGSIDSRAQNITRSMIQILNKAGINYAILGEYEKCSGEIAKRLGEEGRFQQIALENIEIFEMYGVKKIITHCPHCFNVFKLEYPELGGKYKVIHHSEFIARLIKDGRLKIEPFQLRNMIYHDPCNLGRINGIYDEPRDILKASGAKLIEPENTKSKALCCGGGGGNSFYSVPEETKISQIRIKELTSHGVNIISVACPFCMSMFEDAKKTAGLEESIQIKDLAEIIADIIRI